MLNKTTDFTILLLTALTLFFAALSRFNGDKTGLTTVFSMIVAVSLGLVLLAVLALKYMSKGINASNQESLDKKQTFSRDIIISIITSVVFLGIGLSSSKAGQSLSFSVSIYSFGLALIRYFGYYSLKNNTNWKIGTTKIQSSLVTLYSLLYLLVLIFIVQTV